MFIRKEKKGLAPLGQRIASLFKGSWGREEFYEDLEEILIMGDMGASVTMDVVDELRKKVGPRGCKTQQDLLEALREILKNSLLSALPELRRGYLNTLLVLGVNGVGKTTTIAKLARYYEKEGIEKTVLSAGDTFRAAAIDQLKIQGERVGKRVVAQSPGSDPGAVIFDTISSAKSRKEELILADTAGRMHNKTNLVNELKKIDKIVGQNSDPQGIYKKILVLDATTGQNGLQQAEAFHEAIGVDYVVLTKYDATARGGLLIAISRKLGIPISFIGHGEGLEDLFPFEAERYLDELLAL